MNERFCGSITHSLPTHNSTFKNEWVCLKFHNVRNLPLSLSNSSPSYPQTLPPLSLILHALSLLTPYLSLLTLFLSLSLSSPQITGGSKQGEIMVMLAPVGGFPGHVPIGI